jgi:hypothetical protein
MPPVTVADVVGEVLSVLSVLPVEAMELVGEVFTIPPVEAMELVSEVFTIPPVEVAGVEGDELVLVAGVGVLVYWLLEADPQLKLIEWTPS